MLKTLCLLIMTAVSGYASAQVIQVAIGVTKMPYISAENHTGIEYEIIDLALKKAGFSAQIQHMPIKRAQNELAQGRLDAAIHTEGANTSDAYIAYQNMVITLCERRLQIEKIADLSRYQVGSFHNASHVLGTDFARIASDKRRFREISPQQLMNRMLMANHLDVVISDINIFKHTQAEIDPQATKSLCPFAIFAPTLYRLQFRDTTIRDKFNIALKQLREQGLYEALAKKYNTALDQKTPYFKPKGHGSN